MAKYFMLDTDYNEIVKGRLLTEEEYKKMEEEYSEYVLNLEDEEAETMQRFHCDLLEEVLDIIKDDIDNNATPEQLMRYSVRKCLLYNYIGFCIEDNGEIHELDR